MNKGDFVEIEFSGTLQDGQLFDTTHKHDAEKAGIKIGKPGPVLVIVGSPMVVPGVTEQLLQMRVGEEREFDVEPPKAFGPRMPMAVKTFSLAKFMEQKIMPTPGEVLEIDGARVKILSVSGGRVRVDFNHPLAGKVLHYKLKVVKQVEGTLPKAKALLDHYGLERIEQERFADGELSVWTAKPVQPMIQQLLSQKLKEHLSEVKEVAFKLPKDADPAPHSASPGP